MAIGYHSILGLIMLGLLVLPANAGQAQQRGVTVELKAREDRDAPVVARMELYPRSYALVIGNDTYRDPHWVKLSNGVRDARKVSAALMAQGFEVTLKTDLDGNALDETLENFFIDKGSDPEARLFVWYAGHGHTERGEGYLVPVDAPAPDETVTFRRKALSLRQMGIFAREADARHVLAVFDSCFAGTVFDVQRSAPPAAITHATTRPVRQFITSGDIGQTVSDNGTFRRIFIEAIDGRRRADLNGDGFVTGSELGLFLSDRITNYSNGRQTPRYGKLRDPDWDQGDFVFSLSALPPPGIGENEIPAARATNSCVQVWQGIVNSDRQADFELFLQANADCPMAPYARARLEALATESKIAVLSPATEPPFAVEDRAETRTVLKNANVRAAPNVGAERLAMLREGSIAVVTGQVKERNWLRIALGDGKSGFVWAKLLGEVSSEPVKTQKTKSAAITVPQRHVTGALSKGQNFRDCTKCPEMVVLRAGSFMMGASAEERRWAIEAGNHPKRLNRELPQHQVAVSHPFAAGKYEVTREQFAMFVSATGHQQKANCGILIQNKWQRRIDNNWQNPGFAQTERDPVVCVSWEDAKSYTRWLSRITGKEYRLLSEVEWEYAARANSQTPFNVGDRITTSQANFNGNYTYNSSATGDYLKRTLPVGSFASNAFGLHDMHGNVWEWTEDCWNDNYKNVSAPVDGRAWTTGECGRRVMRGGGWSSSPGNLRSAVRIYGTISDRFDFYGFRVAQTISP